MVRNLNEVLNEFYSFRGFKADFGGWITEHDKIWLVDFLQQVSVKSILEIGVFMGGTSNIFLYLQPEAMLVGIDDWSAGNHQAPPYAPTLKEGFEKTTEWSGRATVVTGASKDIGSTWHEPVELIYIDGDHSYETAKTDITNFAKWVVPGGYLLVDDYDMEGVKKAVDEFLGDESMWNVLRVPRGEGDGWHEKLWAAQRIE